MGRSVGRSLYRKSKSKSKKSTKKIRTNNKVQRVQLNVDCLLKIFGYMEIADLANVAASTNFKSIARDVFSRKFAKDVVTVTNGFTTAVPDGQLPSVLLLAQFGDLITKLRVEYSGTFGHRFDQELEDAISEYCGKTVTEIEFKRCSKFAFIRIERPFEAVNKVLFTGYELGSLISKFNTLFPKARSLDFMGEFGITACVVQHFPQLDHLGICNIRTARCGGFAYDSHLQNNVMATINLNPQLTSLTIKHSVIRVDADVLFVINEKLPLLETLEIMPRYNSLVKRVHFENLRKLKLILRFTSSLENIRITTSQPAELTVIGLWLEEIGSFFSMDQKWKKIIVHGLWESLGLWEVHSTYDKFKRQISKLNLLTSLEMSVFGLRGKEDDILALLNECRELNNLTIYSGYLHALELRVSNAANSLSNWKAFHSQNVAEYADSSDDRVSKWYYPDDHWKPNSDDGTFLETYRKKFDLNFKDSAWLAEYEAQDKEDEDYEWIEYTAEYKKQVIGDH